MEHFEINNDTIAAISTPAGTGGIAVIRMSGPEAFSIADRVWQKGNLASAASHTLHFGNIIDEAGETLDEGVAAIFRGPHSFTGEDTVEFSLHGSRWIQREVLALLIRKGARTADAGEFSRRAFLNGRIDLAQAEGIADMIAANSRAAQRMAVNQLKGNFSSRLEALRQQLIDLASLLELELDFSEEEVEFADRSKLSSLANNIIELLTNLADSYSAGRAFREGVPVVIAGRPNAGKSTLLNLLLEDEKAIVSNIPGTTRDIIEDTREIGGILFRFIDTAGLRDADNEVERIGIDRAMQRLEKASVILWMIDAEGDIKQQTDYMRERLAQLPDLENRDTKVFILVNKTDLNPGAALLLRSMLENDSQMEIIPISALKATGIDSLMEKLEKSATSRYNPEDTLIVTNARHYEAITKGKEALERGAEAIRSGISGELIAQDIREAIHHLGEITGTVTTDTLLQTIFSRFCIGK